jgi:hypothetical protein
MGKEGPRDGREGEGMSREKRGAKGPSERAPLAKLREENAEAQELHRETLMRRIIRRPPQQ